jgi:DNA-binding transcriptional LysR family regulator
LHLTQLGTLCELVRRGTLAAAAQHLGYTPGAVSQHLTSLESALGVAPVQRSGRHLVLTDAGRVMAEHAEELLSAEARAVSAPRSAHDAVAGPLVVGTWASSAATLLAPIVERMSVAFPEVSISSREVDLDSASTSVRYGSMWPSASTIPTPRCRAARRSSWCACSRRRSRSPSPPARWTGSL